VLGTY